MYLVYMLQCLLSTYLFGADMVVGRCFVTVVGVARGVRAGASRSISTTSAQKFVSARIPAGGLPHLPLHSGCSNVVLSLGRVASMSLPRPPTRARSTDTSVGTPTMGISELKHLIETAGPLVLIDVRERFEVEDGMVSDMYSDATLYDVVCASGIP
jgi:hypothetical protein